MLMSQAQDRANTICRNDYEVIKAVVAALRRSDELTGEEVATIVAKKKR